MNFERKGELFVPVEPPKLKPGYAIDPPSACPECDCPFTLAGDLSETTVGYFSPQGHDHDDNCLTQSFYCSSGHRTTGSIQRACSTAGCKWLGKANCCGYKNGPKWSRWPEVAI